MANVDTIVALAKRRGFVYPSSEIYGGIGGFWDLGPLGVALARNVRDSWWKSVVESRDDVVGIESSIIMNPKVWEASGHVAAFTDPLTECKLCHARYRADQPDEIAAHEKSHRAKGEKDVAWTEPKQFNLLFKTFVGPVEETKSVAYLRGETCQGIFVNFQNVMASSRVKIPFGIAQIGKSFRNEVTPGKFLFRVREFEQMELEYFVRPEAADAAFAYWKEERMRWHLAMGLKKEHLRFRQHEAAERAHYAADSWDIEYEFPDWGFKELEGIANRTDYDLKTHGKWSGKDLSVTDQSTNTKFVPYVIEPSVGVTRMMLALLFDAYTEDKEKNRVVLAFKPQVAPITAAVFPLLANKPELVEKARSVYTMLKGSMRVAWDERGNIGKRYLAQDEAGTPWCVTVDFDTMEHGTVTVRDRDTAAQERVSVDRLSEYFRTKLAEAV